MGKESKVFDVKSQGLIQNGACSMLQRRLGSTALGLDTGPVSSTGQAFRRYDDVGWPGAIFIAIAHAGCDRHTKG